MLVKHFFKNFVQLPLSCGKEVSAMYQFRIAPDFSATLEN